jgi:membrane protein DedA with SNARE-associated domain
MFDWLTELVSGTPATYPIVAGAVAFDAFFPVVPGETLVVTGAILAAEGQLSLPLLFVAAWVGAVAGDHISFALGAHAGRPMARRLFRGDRSRHMLDWARDQLASRGRILIVAARFVPGGRTAVTFASGMLDTPWRSFIVPDVIGGALWAAYATALGYFGGEAFKENLWKPLLTALAVATVVAGLGELWRRRSERGGGDRTPAR